MFESIFDSVLRAEYHETTGTEFLRNLAFLLFTDEQVDMIFEEILEKYHATKSMQAALEQLEFYYQFHRAGA